MSKLDDLVTEYRFQESALLGRVRQFETMCSQAQRELEVVQAKLQGVLEAAKLIGPVVQKTGNNQRRRTRSLSGHWKKIMQMVSQDKDGFDYGMLAMVADLIGHEAGRDTLRSQMSLYKSAGLVEQIEPGKFRLTPAGLKAADIDPNNKAPGVEAPGARNGRVAELDGPEKTEQHPFRKGENVGSSPTPPASRPETPPSEWGPDDDDVPF